MARSRRTRSLSRRSREISAAGSGEGGDDAGVLESNVAPAPRPVPRVRQLRSIDGEIPRSLAIRTSGWPLLAFMTTAVSVACTATLPNTANTSAASVPSPGGEVLRRFPADLVRLNVAHGAFLEGHCLGGCELCVGFHSPSRLDPADLASHLRLPPTSGSSTNLPTGYATEHCRMPADFD